MAANDETYRLPRDARPHRYELTLRPDLDRARFDGRVVVDLEVLEATHRLVLNSLDLEIRAVRLDPADAAPAHPTDAADGSSIEPRWEEIRSEQKLALAFDHPVSIGRHRLTIDFAGSLNDQLRGFYRSTFRDHDGGTGVIATTQFEASDARRAFPCWDEPDFKAVFSVTLVAKAGLTGISNASLVSTRPLEDGWVEMRFADTMLMSTYLVAFLVGPFELCAPVIVDGVPIRVAALPGKAGLSHYAMEVAAHSLHFLADYFGIPYPGDKLDHVAVPDFAFGAMENLGCATYRESLLLAETESAAQTELQRIAIVVAHETSHMWFGDLVTMKWWDGIWLNEAFATFMELTTTHDFRPEWEVWTAFGAGKAAALNVDGLLATRPIQFPVGPPEEADGMFDVLTYQKGGSVLRMLEQYVGPAVFRKGISHYLATHAYGNTETSDLWDALESISGEPVRAIMGTWILQGGYPMVYASLGVDGHGGTDPATVVLGQRRFVYRRPDGPHGSPERWAIPVNLRASIDGTIHHERLLLEQGEGSYTFPGPVDWVVVNDGAWGFYRVRYSPDLWQLLAEAGPARVLNPLERLQLVGDTWAAVVAGAAELSEWASAARAVAADPDPDVWASIAGVLTSLDLIVSDADRPSLQRFAEELAREPWDRVGWDPQPGESRRTATARARIAKVRADFGRDPDVIAEAQRRFATHLEASLYDPLAPDLVGVAARIAVSEGGEQGWSEVLDAYRDAEGPHEQLRYLHALSETPHLGLRLRTLDLMAGPEVRSQDAPFVIAEVMARRGAAAEVWAWVEQNWDRLAARFPSSLLTRVFEATWAIVDPDVAARVHAFCAAQEIPMSQVRLAQILERMDVQVALAGRLRGAIVSGLAHQ